MPFSLNQPSTIPSNQLSGEERQAPNWPTGILFGALATPLIPLFAQPVFAFSITPPQPGATNVYFPRFEYTVNGDGWVSRLDPLSTLPTGGTSGFNSLLSPFEANGWTFSQGQTLNGSFNIDTLPMRHLQQISLEQILFWIIFLREMILSMTPKLICIGFKELRIIIPHYSTQGLEFPKTL